MRRWPGLSARLTSWLRSSGSVTELLLARRLGDARAAERLARAIRTDLEWKAGVLLRRARSRQALQPSVLVRDSYERLVDPHRVSWQDRACYLGLAAETLRRILVELALGGAREERLACRVILDEALSVSGPRALDVVALHDALGELTALDPRQGHVVELRAFGGLSVEETAEVLAIPAEMVKRCWSFSRAWLTTRLAFPPSP
jgi:RNA polymerase sigma-70 factor (ECF subfamily)